jgi:ketosteroid isomerase-like protein
MKPKDVVKAWVEAFNRADVDALTSFYRDGAINHQVAEQPVEGRDAIREMFVTAFATARWCASWRTCSRTANGRSSSGAIQSG